MVVYHHIGEVLIRKMIQGLSGLRLGGRIDRTMVPQRCPHIVHYLAKRDLAAVIMGFEWGDGSGVLGRLNQITRVLAKVREEGHRRCESRSWSWSGAAITQATLEV